VTVELAALAAVQPVVLAAPQDAATSLQAMQPAAASQSFGQMVASGLEGVNGDLLASQTDLQQLAVGNVQNLHQMMIKLEESRLSFQVFMQARNRLLEAYQDVMKMQV